MINPVAIGFRVHVKPDISEITRQAKKIGIVLAPTDDRRAEEFAVDTGVVIDVGPDAWKDYGHGPWVNIGDKVVYARHAGYRVGTDDDFILVLNDGDIVTKLEEPASA